jgi:hypothetical protein
MKRETEVKTGGIAIQHQHTGITVGGEAVGNRVRKRYLAAVLALAAAFSLSGRAEQTNAPQAAQQTQTVQVVNSNAQPVPVQTSPALAPYWGAVRNGTFTQDMGGLTIPYTHSSPDKRAIVRHISVECNFSVAAQAYVVVSGYLGPLAFPLTYLPNGYGNAYAVGGVPVELILDAGGAAYFAISRTTANGTGQCKVYLSGYTVPQPPQQ